MTSVAYVFVLLIATSHVVSIVGEDAFSNPFVKATCDLTVELLKSASEEAENTVLSPASVSMILSLLQQGARGNTATELEEVLGLSAETTKTSYENMLRTLTEKSTGVTVEWGNKAYVKSGLDVGESFRSDMEKSFKTEFEELNFSEQSSQDVADLINNWIRGCTHDQIQEAVKPYMVGPDTLMLLVNVIYFKGNWLHRFREKNSKNGLFEKSPSESVPVTFMYQRNKYYTGRNDTLGVRWVELPFQGESHKLYFVLPLKRHSLTNVMKRITGEDLIDIFNYGDVTEVRLRVPKLKLKRNYSLVNLLQQLGLKDIFTDGSDLSGISSEPLQVSEAVHEAAFEMDEKGATASAATVVTLSRKLILSETFRLDQPFLFFIVDSVNQIPLFAGRVTNPTVS